MAGYSSVPLIQKLGFKEGMSVWLVNVPENYKSLLGGFPQGIVESKGQDTKVDFIHFFTRSHEALKEEFGNFKKRLKSNGMLWISWPKSTCSFASTDLTDNTVREVGLENGLVDVKVAAIDEDWSGIKFVYRLRDRK